jgi:hypothetical protein
MSSTAKTKMRSTAASIGKSSHERGEDFWIWKPHSSSHRFPRDPPEFPLRSH